ncbi:MAG TPA: hypothetical protein V6C97_07730 [Oculatellaceae cyanobacterium]
MSDELGPLQKNEIRLTTLPRLSGKRYLFYGSSLMLFKYGIDTTFSWLVFHRSWTPLQYFVPSPILDPNALTSGGDAGFYASMLILSLPFAFIGSDLTLRRLRAIGLPPWLVVLFFIPYLNMLFFTILVIVESKPGSSPAGEDQNQIETDEALGLPNIRQGRALTLNAWSNDAQLTKKQLPTHVGVVQTRALSLLDKLPSEGNKALFMTALLPVPVSVLAAILSVTVLGVYGEGVFTAIPFVAGVAAPVLYGWNRRRTFWECVAVSVICLLIMAGVLLIIPIEGIICLLMASPLALGIGVVGGAVGYVIQAHLPRSEHVPKLLGCFAAILPLLMLGDYLASPTYPVYAVVSSLEIAAPPEVVWGHLINIAPMPVPDDWLFKTGIAYPVQAKTTGKGPGAIRQCIFSTGRFVEPIEIWDAPHLLKFGVVQQAPPMRELSPYPNLHPAHLDNYLQAKEGEFKLTALPNGSTRLDGTTWYQNFMGPGFYWRLWSDFIIEKIHMRVMNHVKVLAESEIHSIKR